MAVSYLYSSKLLVDSSRPSFATSKWQVTVVIVPRSIRKSTGVRNIHYLSITALDSAPSGHQ